jgi:UDP-glucuronate decarboxylase
MNKILASGGAGFLDGTICDRQVERGNEVLCVDNFFTGCKRNIRHLLGQLNFDLSRHDAIFPPYMGVDRIFKLACPASPVHYQFDAVQTIKIIVQGAIDMLDLPKWVKARIPQASASEVYGNPDSHPQTGDQCGEVNPTGIRSCFGESKCCA